MLEPQLLELLMQEALLEARAAEAAGEVPVGAVIAHNNVIIGRGRNSTERDLSVASHAEMHAINAASQKLASWRLNECVLCVTLEPCTMCLGAIRLARVPTIVFGSGDSRQGALGSLYDLSLDERLGPAPRVIRNVRAEECTQILQRFFKKLRT